jgi:hypothetical protein
MMKYLGLCKPGVEVKKPVCGLEYNQQMDQKLQPYLVERKRGHEKGT